MRERAAAATVGAVFGLTLAWSGMSSLDVLREGLLFESSYLFGFFLSALATALVGLRLLRRTTARSRLTGEPLDFAPVRVERPHVVGSALFGVGWAVADVCPGPVAAQLGQGVPWSLATAAGLVLGVWWFLRRGSPRTV